MVLWHNSDNKSCFFKTEPFPVCALFLIRILFSTLRLIAPGNSSMCFLYPLLMSSTAPKTTGVVSVSIPHFMVVSIPRSLYLESFSVISIEVFLSHVTDIYEFAGFVLLVFHRYIRLVSSHFSVCVYLHVAEYRSFLVSSHRCWFMFIPLAQ